MPQNEPVLQTVDALAGKTFLVCIGAAKCGTSWLHSYFAGLPGMAVSPLKELHFFNAKFGAHAMGDMEALAIKRVGLHLNRDGNPVETLLKSADYQASVDRMQMIYDDNAYFSHFARLSGPATRTLCDVTPAYSVLGLNGFTYMRDFFATQPDLRLRLVYILRDPVDRLWSQLRHLQEVNPASAATTRWAEAIRSPSVLARADYAGTIDDLEITFPPDDVLYLFYEDLFTVPALQRLCAFADVPYQPGDTDQRQNRTRVDTPLPDDAKAAFREVLAGQYAFCRERFGEAVPASWHA
ncbi:sulfotransferase [Gymnodinialimonas sp.]